MMDEVEIQTLDDYNDIESEADDYASENIDDDLESCEVVKEEIEYGDLKDYVLENDSEYSEYSETHEDNESSADKYKYEMHEFKWDRRTILLLLREYKTRLHKFRDNKYKKSDLWLEISDVFKLYGFEVHRSMLDKKFRNMKNTFVNIFFNNIDKTKSVKWEYYHMFVEIFKDDDAFKLPPSYETVTTQDSCLPEDFSDKQLELPATKRTTSNVEAPEMKTPGFIWTHEKCTLLLNEYKVRLKFFKNPQFQKRALWQDISQVFHSRGYNVGEEALYKKFRNMKQTFITNLRGDKPIKWIYQSIFSELFEDVTVPVGTDVSTIEMYSCDDVAVEQSLSEIRLFGDHLESEETKDGSEESVENEPNKQDYDSEFLQIQRKRLLLDNERVSELKKLRLTLEDSNRVQGRRNDLLEQLINVIKEK